MSSRTWRWLRIFVALALVSGVLAQFTFTRQSSASPTSAFEIDDANIVDGAAAAPDWGSIFGRNPVGGANAPVVVKNAAGLLTASFSEDPISSDPLPTPPCAPGKTGDLTTFVAGGSDKNGDPIDSLEFESNSDPNSKDALPNITATAKKDGNDNIFYFGLARANPNGSSHFDFEFLKAPMGMQATGTDSSGCP